MNIPSDVETMQVMILTKVKNGVLSYQDELVGFLDGLRGGDDEHNPLAGAGNMSLDGSSGIVPPGACPDLAAFYGGNMPEHGAPTLYRYEITEHVSCEDTSWMLEAVCDGEEIPGYIVQENTEDVYVFPLGMQLGDLTCPAPYEIDCDPFSYGNALTKVYVYEPVELVITEPSEPDVIEEDE